MLTCSITVVQWKNSCLYSAHWLHLMRKKAKSGHMIIFDFYFSPRAFQSPFTFTLSFSFPPSLCCFIDLSLSLSSDLVFMSFLQEGLQRGGRWPLSPASLLRFRCSCWAAIKTVKKRRFHTNYDTIEKHLVKRRSENEGQTLISVK